MSSLATAPPDAGARSGSSWKLPVVFGVVSVVALLAFGVRGDSGTSTFSLASDSDFVSPVIACFVDV